MPAICDLLAQFNDRGILSAKELAACLGKASAYRYFTDCVPDAQQLRTLFHGAPPGVRVKVQADILDFFTAGTPWLATFMGYCDMASDGKVDAGAVLDGCTKGLRHAADALEFARSTERLGFNEMQASDAQVLNAELMHAINCLFAARRAVHLLSNPELRQKLTAAPAA